jgi:hypothetical protein
MEQTSDGGQRGGRVSGAGVVPAADSDADRDQGDAQRRRRSTQSEPLLTPCSPGTCGRYPRPDFYVPTVRLFSRS